MAELISPQFFYRRLKAFQSRLLIQSIHVILQSSALWCNGKHADASDCSLCVTDVCVQTVPHLLQGSSGVGAHSVQLVDEGEEGDAVAFHLSVYRHGLTLDASHRAQNQHGSIQHAQRTLHLDGEVHVTCEAHRVQTHSK